MAGTAAWFLLASNKLAVAHIEVSGDAGEKTDGELKRMLVAEVDGTLILRVSTEALASHLAVAFPEIQSVVVRRRFPDRLLVTYEQRHPYGVWCRARGDTETCASFDALGISWGTSIPSSGTLLLSVLDERPNGTLERPLLDSIILLVEHLRAIDVSVRRVILPAVALEEVRVVSTEGSDIRFSLQADLPEQLAGLETFLADQRKKGDFAPAYLDVRVPGKIYYR
jgi:hypothetical protein